MFSYWNGCVSIVHQIHFNFTWLEAHRLSLTVLVEFGSNTSDKFSCFMVADDDDDGNNFCIASTCFWVGRFTVSQIDVA